VRGVSTAFWSIVLAGSTMSIAAGFVGGRSIGSAASQPVADARHAQDSLPAPIRQRVLRRSLFGPHSLDAAVAFDPYADPELGVTSRTRPDAGFDARTDRGKIAVIVVDAGSAGGLDRFINSPLPLTLAVAPADDDASNSVDAIESGGKTAVIDADGTSPASVAKLLHTGAQGVIASLDESHAKALLKHIDRNAIVVDTALSEDDDLNAVGRSMHRPVYVRDVIADARDDNTYVDFMLRNALAIAQRTGSAIVAVHARTTTLDALTRFADRAQRDGADLVALTDLGH
jgi:polysaccharide deacetylase 2 family uncharacterized protein YibQ